MRSVIFATRKQMGRRSRQGDAEKFFTFSEKRFICLFFLQIPFQDDAEKSELFIQIREKINDFLRLRSHTSAEEAAALFTIHKQGVGFGQSKSALNRTPTDAELFVNMLPIPGMLATCLETFGPTESLKELCSISDKELTIAVKAFSLSLIQVLREEVDKLKALIAATGTQETDEADGSASKFEVPSTDAGPEEERPERLGDGSGGASPARRSAARTPTRSLIAGRGSLL